MHKHFLTAVVLSVVTAGAMALPVSTVQLRTSTAALIPGAADDHFDASPATSAPGIDPNPLLTQSYVAGASDFASGGAVAATGLFSTTAEADSASSFATAAAGARYIATFSDPGFLTLHLDFSFANSASPTSTALGGLSVLVTSGGATVIDRFLTSTGVLDFQLALGGRDQTIDLQLSSEASSNPSGGFASSSSRLVFDAAVTPVPEPSVWWMTVAGLLMVGFRLRRSSPVA